MTVQQHTLSNGFRIVTEQMPGLKSASIGIWVTAGGRHERIEQNGIAHFLEHLMFKGTDTLAPGEFSQTVAAQGGSDNAFTSDDYTGYFQRVAADRLPLMMQMEADRMEDLALTEDDIRTERDVVIEERNQRTENNASALAREQMMAAQYLNHRYGVPIIGWRHELDELE